MVVEYLYTGVRDEWLLVPNDRQIDTVNGRIEEYYIFSSL